MRNYKNFLQRFIVRLGRYHRKINPFIFYKIIESSESSYTLHCINTKAIFQITLVELVSDKQILYALHPVQACFIGIEFANRSMVSEAYKSTMPTQLLNRYGKYKIVAIDRDKKISVLNLNTRKIEKWLPSEIALSEKMISCFDASQAFYIGYLSGKIIDKIILPKQIKHSKPSLRLIKQGS